MLKLEITRRKDSLLLQLPNKVSPEYKTVVYSQELPAIKVIIDSESFSSTKSSDKIQKIIPLDELEVDLSSQAIEFVNYLPNEKALIVNFWNQGCYLYYNIPETLYALLLIAESKGSFFHKIIQKKYKFKKIPSEFTVFDVKQAIQEEQQDELEEISLNMKEVYQKINNSEALLNYWNQAQSTFEKIEILKNPNFPISTILPELEDDYWLVKLILSFSKERLSDELRKTIQDKYQGHRFISKSKEITTDTISIIVPHYYSLCTHISGLKTIPQVDKKENTGLKKGQALMKMDSEGNLELIDYKIAI